MEAWEGNRALAREGRTWSRENSHGATQGVDPIQRSGVGSPTRPHQIVPSSSQSFDGLAAPCVTVSGDVSPVGSESTQFQSTLNANGLNRLKQLALKSVVIGRIAERARATEGSYSSVSIAKCRFFQRNRSYLKQIHAIYDLSPSFRRK